MATKLTDTRTVTTTGVYDPATLTKFPEGGGTFSVSLNTGAAIVQLRAWNTSMPATAKEILATFQLPVPNGPKINDLFDSLPVFSIWDDYDWNVTTLTGGGTLRLSTVGIGV